MQQKNNYSTSAQAEQAFYLAFQQSDIEMMMPVWSKDENTVCIHPGGSRLDDLHTIRESWEQIFSHEQGIKFDIKQKRVLLEKNIAIHHVIEAISMQGELQSEIIATNIYQKTKNSWHMILHHASPELHAAANQVNDDADAAQTIH